jgi:mannose-6-phosphate isomerase-like protein (cupin superfamily)
MSFYNFKLNDPSAGVTSSTHHDTKSPGRFVHKTLADYRRKGNVNIAPKGSTSKTVVTSDGRGKFAVAGWKEQGVIAPGGEKSRFRLDKNVPQQVQDTPQTQTTRADVPEIPVEDGALDGEGVDVEGVDVDIHDELVAVSINTTLQGITHTYSPLNIGMLHSMGSPTSIRLVKLSGQSSWHSHDNTDEIFIILRGGIQMLYRTLRGEDKSVRFIGGELLRVPMRMEHCVVADEGTEVILMEGKDGTVLLSMNMLTVGRCFWIWRMRRVIFEGGAIHGLFLALLVGLCFASQIARSWHGDYLCIVRRLEVRN